MWMRRGQQREIPSPGQNSKVAAFGAVNPNTGQHRAHVPQVSKGGKNSAQFILFAAGLLVRARRTGKRIRLVLDQGPIHKSKKTTAFLNHSEVHKHIEIFWLPKYAPNLNDQERVWKVAKGQGVANVLFAGRDSFMRQVVNVLSSINAKPGAALCVNLARRRDPDRIRKTLGTST